jgi:hypothetical protein
MEKIQEIIQKLENEIRESDEMRESEDDASWNYQEGILLSKATVRVIVDLLKASQSKP